MKRNLSLFICLLVFFETIFISHAFGDEILENTPFIATFSNSTDYTGVPKIGANAAIVMDAESGRVLF